MAHLVYFIYIYIEGMKTKAAMEVAKIPTAQKMAKKVTQ